MDYKKQIKSAKWQKKRLEILERDYFTCTNCHDDENQLHVHHTYYESDRMIWEYENESLLTLCNDCHESLHKTKADLKQLIDKNFIYEHDLRSLKLVIDELKGVKHNAIAHLAYFISTTNKPLK